MPQYSIMVAGCDFAAEDDGHDYPDIASAGRAAINAAAAIAVDDVQQGESGAVLEAVVSDGDTKILGYVIALSVEPFDPETSSYLVKN